ncbi:YeeE/YedE family protein [Rhizobiales bacterium]|uniref:YeeE/YedE family protein n=1 Tax=Hongsoonwoonella zoysiae TaxID=2821844 RepID=UPI0015619902|nr:YeeE/YedE family protein [Hongsoonwoonella zoysiae]NRG16331.1 YeeE/YedE family protein [Hongsoonwoonella zoysiae]
MTVTEGQASAPRNYAALFAGVTAFLVVAIFAGQAGGMRLALAAAIGAVAGISLYHASFGFTSAWRRLVTERRGAGLRAQFLLIALTIVISYPLIGWGRDFGIPAGGFVFPFGVAAAIGAFTFGVGMQLGGGCASGTLFTAGGGSTRMMITLAFFVAGSVLATAHMHLWNALPSLPAYSLVTSVGPVMAVALTLFALALLAAGTVAMEKRAHGSLVQRRPTGSWLSGPWSLAAGAVAIAFVSIATLIVLGRPWGITSGFALWGAKIGHALGVPVADWPYWRGQAAAIEGTVFRDATSVMNFGIIIGAMVAASLAGKFAPVWSLSRRDVVTAVIGGLLMGYGARLAYGCNIGAYLGGVVSGSLHGWLWLVFGFAGSVVGTRLRFIVGMDRRVPVPSV